MRRVVLAFVLALLAPVFALSDDPSISSSGGDIILALGTNGSVLVKSELFVHGNEVLTEVEVVSRLARLTARVSALEAQILGPCVSQPCQNGATCIDGDSFSCVCPVGFTGSLCGQQVDECASSPCRFGADCSPSVDSGFTCTCPFGLRCDGPPFISSWLTDFAGETVVLPLSDTGDYDFIVNWGDNSAEDEISAYNDVAATHAYTVPGLYNITITGTLRGWVMVSQLSRLQIRNIYQWGSLQLGNTGQYFWGATHLTITASDTLNMDGTTSLDWAFASTALSANTGLDRLDVSQVTLMQGTFFGDASFVDDLSSWNTSRVTTFANMFRGCSKMNFSFATWDTSSAQDISSFFNGCHAFEGVGVGNFDTSHVRTLVATFKDCYLFNSPVNSWDTSRVTTLQSTFHQARVFNQPLDQWNTSQVTNLVQTFFSASAFNSPVFTDTSQVITMLQTFFHAYAFNQPVPWDTRQVTTLSSMFADARLFNQPLLSFDTSRVTDFSSFLHNAFAFNQSLAHFDLQSALYVGYFFRGTTSFSGNLDMWETKSVEHMSHMFSSSNFNGNINSWNVSNVISMSFMFEETSLFNQDISAWTPTRTTDMEGMFNLATAFNQDLSTWCTPLISTPPASFATGATAWLAQHRPIWSNSTCP